MKILAVTDLHYSDLSRNRMRNNKPNAVLARTYFKKAILRRGIS